MKTILVLRHAKSDWTTGAADFDRPLTARGRRGARQAGAVLRNYDIDLVWCSGARRTRETWELAQAGGAHTRELDVRRSFYGVWADSLLSELTLLDESVSQLLIVNHQPTVGDLVDALAQPSELADQVAYHFPTAALAVLVWDGTWSALARQGCVLRSFTRPEA
jgi:phosphohistidine phosphatase